MMTSDQFISQAKDAFAAGEILSALLNARRAVTLQPSSAVATTVLGVVLAKTGSETGARMAYRWAIPASGGREPKAFSNLGRVEEIAGREDIAKSIYREGIERNPGADGLVERLVKLHIKKREWSLAGASLSKLSDSHSTSEAIAELCAVVGSQLAAGSESDLAMILLNRAQSVPNRMVPSAVLAHARMAKNTITDQKQLYETYRRALVFNPVQSDIILALVNNLNATKKKVQAAGWYCQYSTLHPDDEKVLRQSGQLAYEVRWPWRSVGRAMVLHQKYPNDPNFSEILQDMFSQFKTEEELPYAKAWAISVLERNYDDPRFWDASLRLLHNLKFHEEAEPFWGKANQKFPTMSALHHNRALFLQEQGLNSKSGSHAKRAVILTPDYQRAYNILAMYFNGERRVKDAIRLGRRFLKIDEAKPSYWMNYGTFHRGLGDLTGAMRAFRTALMHDPKYAEAEFNVSITAMMMGELYEAFRAYERRWAIPTFPSPVRLFAKKIWGGPYSKDPHPSILVYMEQGMGDEIMFSWYLPFLIKDAKKVLLDCDERLVGIMKRTYPEIDCVARTPKGDPRAHDPKWTHKAPIGHLPQHYVPQVRELMRRNWDLYCKRGERHLPRMVVDPERLELWRKRLKDRFGDKPVVGVSWRSSLHTPIRDGQYVSIPEIAKSLGSDVGVINLQYSFTEDEHEQFKALGTEYGFDFHTPREIDLKDDLEDIFAILQLCDACVTPLISLAWMSGAVGTPTWVFRTAAELRTFHMLGAPFLVWAPSIKLFFRRPGTPWDEVIEAIGATVAHLAETGEARDVADPRSVPLDSTW